MNIEKSYNEYIELKAKLKEDLVNEICTEEMIESMYDFNSISIKFLDLKENKNLFKSAIYFLYESQIVKNKEMGYFYVEKKSSGDLTRNYKFSIRRNGIYSQKYSTSCKKNNYDNSYWGEDLFIKYDTETNFIDVVLTNIRPERLEEAKIVLDFLKQICLSQNRNRFSTFNQIITFEESPLSFKITKEDKEDSNYTIEDINIESIDFSDHDIKIYFKSKTDVYNIEIFERNRNFKDTISSLNFFKMMVVYKIKEEILKFVTSANKDFQDFYNNKFKESHTAVEILKPYIALREI